MARLPLVALVLAAGERLLAAHEDLLLQVDADEILVGRARRHFAANAAAAAAIDRSPIKSRSINPTDQGPHLDSPLELTLAQIFDDRLL